MNDDLIKVAYGIGCMQRLTQHNIDSNDFVKAAAASDDRHAQNAADAMLAVVHYVQATPQDVEKVASVVLEKTAFLDGKNYAEAAGENAGIGAGIGAGVTGAGLLSLLGLKRLGKGIPEIGDAVLPSLREIGGAGIRNTGMGAGIGAASGLAYEELRDPSLKERFMGRD